MINSKHLLSTAHSLAIELVLVSRILVTETGHAGYQPFRRFIGNLAPLFKGARPRVGGYAFARALWLLEEACEMAVTTFNNSSDSRELLDVVGVVAMCSEAELHQLLSAIPAWLQDQDARDRPPLNFGPLSRVISEIRLHANLLSRRTTEAPNYTTPKRHDPMVYPDTPRSYTERGCVKVHTSPWSPQSSLPPRRSDD